MSSGIFGERPQRKGSSSVGGYAMMREYEFQRSVRVRQAPSNVSLTMIGVKPPGTDMFSGISSASTRIVNTGLRHALCAANAARSGALAPPANAQAAAPAISAANRLAVGPSRTLRIPTTAAQPSAAPSRSTP